MIEALAANRSNHPFPIRSLPRRARCRQNFADTHVSHLFSEVIAKDRIAVAEQEARELGKRKCFPYLLCGPLRGRMSGHMEMQDAASVMGQHQKHVKYLEADRRHREEVDGDQLLGVILQECAPGLRWGLGGAHQVFADAALCDVDAEFEEFAMDAGCTPTGILPAHLADQIADLARKDRSSRLAAPHLPGPEQAKAGTMPGKDRFWLDDGQRRAPVMPEAEQADPQQAVG